MIVEVAGEVLFLDSLIIETIFSRSIDEALQEFSEKALASSFSAYEFGVSLVMISLS